MIGFFFLMLTLPEQPTCWVDYVAPPPQAWVDYFGEPICPPEGSLATRGQTVENTLYVRGENFLVPGYSMEKSARGTIAFFTNPAHMAIAESTRASAMSTPIEERIKQQLGIDFVPFGELVSADSSQVNASVTEWVLTFSSGAAYQYFIRTPDSPNGRALILLHGCGTSAKTTALAEEADYMNKLGQHATNAGYVVIVPYVNGYCFMDNQIDKLGQASGVNHLAYEIQGIRKVVEHANRSESLSLYGISKGGVLAMMMMALDSNVYDTVTVSGHEVIDYLKRGQLYFASPARNKHYAYVERWGRYMTTDEMVMDYLSDNPDGIAVLEMSTYDAGSTKDLVTVQRLITQCRTIFTDCTERLRTIWFTGVHEPAHWLSFQAMSSAVPTGAANNLYIPCIHGEL